MANKKKVETRSEFIIVRVTPSEKESMIKKAGKNVSNWVRSKLGL